MREDSGPAVGPDGGTAPPPSVLEALGADSQRWSCRFGQLLSLELLHSSGKTQPFPAPSRTPVLMAAGPHTTVPVSGEPVGAVVCIPGLPAAATTSPPALSTHQRGARPLGLSPNVPTCAEHGARAGGTDRCRPPHSVQPPRPSPPLPLSQATLIPAATKGSS